MEEKKSYLIVWTYMSNYGSNIVEAYSQEEAIKNHLFYDRDDISLIACPIEEVIIKQTKEGQTAGTDYDGLLKEVRK